MVLLYTELHIPAQLSAGSLRETGFFLEWFDSLIFEEAGLGSWRSFPALVIPWFYKTHISYLIQLHLQNQKIKIHLLSPELSESVLLAGEGYKTIKLRQSP